MLQKRLYELQKALGDRFARRVESLGQRLDLLAYRLIHPGQHLTRQREQIERLNHRLSTMASGHRAPRDETDTPGSAPVRSAPGHAKPSSTTGAARRPDASRRADREKPADSRTHATRRQLELLDPRKILARGYSIITTTDGRIVRDSRLLEPNDTVSVSFYAGGAEARITSTHH